MPYNGVGVFQRVYQWVNDAANGIFVDATRTDTDSNDIASGLTNCVTRDGQSPWLANIPAAGFKITGLGAGNSTNDSVNYGQVFTSPTFSGTANFTAITVAGGAANMAAATSVTVPTVIAGDNSNNAASTAFATALAFAAALPAQAGNANRFITTDGSVASWTNLIKSSTMLLADSTDTTKRGQFVLSGISTGQTRTLTLRDRNAVIGADMQLDTRSSGTNTQFTVADIAKFVDITTGTFTQTFDACASLTSGWWIRVRNNGTGNITLDPNGAELIDGLASYIMYPGEVRDIQCDSTKLTSVVVKPYRVRFIASGTWTKPPGYSEHGGVVGSAGASGYKSSASSISPGGCGGGAFPFNIPDSQLGATETITIGAGGAPQTVANTAGNTGGTSSFGSWISVIGGANDSSGSSNLSGAVADSKGNRLFTSASQIVGFETNQSSSATEGVWSGGKSDAAGAAASGGSINGGGAGGSTNAAGTLRAAGTSKTAGAGGAASVGGNGVAGTFPLGGGGSTQTGAQSGAGANGYVDVWGGV